MRFNEAAVKRMTSVGGFVLLLALLPVALLAGGGGTLNNVGVLPSSTPAPTATPPLSLTDTQYIRFDLTGTVPANVEGIVYWNNDENTLNVSPGVDGVLLQVGLENYRLGVNKTGAPITNGLAVYISGAQGNRPTFSLASYDSYTTAQAIGLATQDIADNDEGYATVMGDVRGVDTSAWAAGDELWLAASGTLTNVKPTAANTCAMFLGTAANSTVNGTISANPQWRCDKFGDIPGGDYADFEADGFLQMYSGARSWVDFNFGTGALGAGASAPDLVKLNATNIYLFGFDGNVTSEQTFFSAEMNHNWAEGTTIEPHIHWTPTTTATGTVVWYLSYAVAKPGETIGASDAVISVTSQITTNSQWKPMYSDFPTITMTGYEIENQFNARLYRAPTGVDTYPDDAAVMTIGLHVLIDAFGSREESDK